MGYMSDRSHELPAQIYLPCFTEVVLANVGKAFCSAKKAVVEQLEIFLLIGVAQSFLFQLQPHFSIQRNALSLAIDASFVILLTVIVAENQSFLRTSKTALQSSLLNHNHRADK